MMRFIAALPLLFLWPALRHVVESSMALHMLVQFPALLASGWGAARLAGVAPMRRLDAHGLLGLTAASCVAAYWMVPAALNLSLLSPAVNVAKYLSWWLAGACFGSSWQHFFWAISRGCWPPSACCSARRRAVFASTTLSTNRSSPVLAIV
jgi:hypothetical protein